MEFCSVNAFAIWCTAIKVLIFTLEKLQFCNFIACFRIFQIEHRTTQEQNPNSKTLQIVFMSRWIRIICLSVFILCEDKNENILFGPNGCCIAVQ